MVTLWPIAVQIKMHGVWSVPVMFYMIPKVGHSEFPLSRIAKSISVVLEFKLVKVNELSGFWYAAALS